MFEMEISVIFYSVLAGLATIVGIYIIGKNERWALENSHYVNSFAAGLIMALVFFHLLPEAIELSDSAFYAIFIGFFIFYLLENFIVIHSGSEIHYCLDEHEDGSSKVHHSSRLGLMSFSGLAFHSLVDGVVIGVGFELSTEIGLLAAFAVILHEIPEGVTSFALINKTIPDKSKLLSIIVAAATPVGAIFSLLFIYNLSDSFIGILLALAAGTFIYVAASDLIPETHSSNNIKNLAFFLFGAVIILIISLV